jgi:homoserine trans-succinylase
MSNVNVNPAKNNTLAYFPRIIIPKKTRIIDIIIGKINIPLNLNIESAYPCNHKFKNSKKERLKNFEKTIKCITDIIIVQAISTQ